MAGPPPPAGADATSHRARGRWLILAATLFWGVSATLARHLFRDLHLPALVVVEMRLAIAAALLLPWLALRRPERLRVGGRRLAELVVLGVLGVAAVQGSYYYAVSTLGVGLAILLQYIAPALVLIYSALRGERVGAIAVVAVIAALAGTVLLVGNVDAAAISAGPMPWIAGFGSAFIFAYYIVASKSALRRNAPETVLVYTFAIAAVFWSFAVPPWMIAAAHYSLRVWLLFLALGVTSTLVPFGLFYSGLRSLDAQQAGVLATAEPLIAVLSAWLLLGEGLRPIQWLGASLVLVAATLAATRASEPVAAPAHPA